MPMLKMLLLSCLASAATKSVTSKASLMYELREEVGVNDADHDGSLNEAEYVAAVSADNALQRASYYAMLEKATAAQAKEVLAKVQEGGAALQKKAGAVVDNVKENAGKALAKAQEVGADLQVKATAAAREAAARAGAVVDDVKENAGKLVNAMQTGAKAKVDEFVESSAIWAGTMKALGKVSDANKVQGEAVKAIISGEDDDKSATCVVNILMAENEKADAKDIVLFIKDKVGGFSDLQLKGLASLVPEVEEVMTSAMTSALERMPMLLDGKKDKEWAMELGLQTTSRAANAIKWPVSLAGKQQTAVAKWVLEKLSDEADAPGDNKLIRSIVQAEFYLTTAQQEVWDDKELDELKRPHISDDPKQLAEPMMVHVWGFSPKQNKMMATSLEALG